MTMIKKKNISNADPEYGVDSRYSTAKEREQDAVALLEGRLEKIKKLPREQILRARLLQLKLQMENYLKVSVADKIVNDKQNHFASFVASYVDTLYSKRSAFAKDISITPVFLSQVINSHREPKEEFILKLMIHSEKVFKHVGEFQKQTWYEVYLHEKLSDTMSNQHTWRPKIEKQVKLKAAMVK